MGNKWKAKCVDVGSCQNAKLTDVIVVENGTVVICNYGKWIGYSGEVVQSFNNWFKYHETNTGTKWELITDETSSDNINPSHYKNQCSLECIDAMIMAFGSETVYYFCICNAWKYMWRYQNKNGVEDIKKARWYVDKAKELIPEYLEWQNINEVLTTIEKDMTERGELS